MRNFIRTISFVLAMLIATSITAFAADSYITLNGFSFDINDSSEAIIHSYDDRSDSVVIPATLLSAPVTTIDDYAFFGDESIKTLSFENADNLTKIGTNAFYGCKSLSELSLSSGVTELGFGVFQNCSGLRRVNLGSGVASIPKQAFLGCTSLEKVVISDNAASIDERAFGSCTSLVDVEIPSSVTSISENAFEGSDNVVIYCYKGSYAEAFAKANGISYDYITSYKLGDSNLDGLVNIMDVTVIQKYKVGLADISAYRRKLYADVNGDGKITIRDATLIQMYLASMSVDFEIGKIYNPD